MLRFPAIVLARLSSSRLPNKAIHTIAGKPCLDYIIETLRSTECISEIMIATSIEPSDDPLEIYSTENQLHCYRGSLLNVAERFNGSLRKLRCTAAFRVNGDSPLISSELLNLAATEYTSSSWDLITNIHPRTYPRGMSIELVNSKAYDYVATKITSPSHMEHVTNFFYDSPQLFAIKNIRSTEYFGDYHFAVDTVGDLSVLERLFTAMTKPHWQYSASEVVSLYNKLGINRD